MPSTNNPTILIYFDEDHVYMRFQNLRGRQLQLEVSALKKRISTMKWLRKEGYWQMPKAYLQQVALFAYERFGPNTLIPINKSTVPKQMELPL